MYVCARLVVCGLIHAFYENYIFNLSCVYVCVRACVCVWVCACVRACAMFSTLCEYTV